MRYIMVIESIVKSYHTTRYNIKLFLLVRCRSVHKQKCKRPFSIDYGEPRSHARGVYPTQDTSNMRTTNPGESRGRNRYQNSSKREVRNLEERNVGNIRGNLPNKS